MRLASAAPTLFRLNHDTNGSHMHEHAVQKEHVDDESGTIITQVGLVWELWHIQTGRCTQPAK